ncbi:MAG TPA: DUF427 domain-containing protein [Amnibacterium sp.]|jgi:uncharacterized protein (DUF427 family)|uniref:DUF427 domain-containing protein n=1 Tax=Amnibacterium sp. TaxID=1872496 RepID=UPI002F946648
MRSVQRVEPGPGQESVWDYPRPPRVEATTDRIRIRLGGETVVDTTDAVRVLETSHPPVYYVRRDEVHADLVPAPGASFCEFKGAARYLSIAAGDRAEAGAVWYYPSPAPGYEALADRVAVYPARMDSCEVAGETVQPQDGDFYGGWITSRVVGPFKGAPGTLGW